MGKTLASFPRLINAVLKFAPYEVITTLKFVVVGENLWVSMQAGGSTAGYEIDGRAETTRPETAAEHAVNEIGARLAEASGAVRT